MGAALSSGYASRPVNARQAASTVSSGSSRLRRAGSFQTSADLLNSDTSLADRQMLALSLRFGLDSYDLQAHISVFVNSCSALDTGSTLPAHCEAFGITVRNV